MNVSPCWGAVILAYIDPGLLALALQGLFALIFGLFATYALLPWRMLKSLFRRKGTTESRAAEPVSPEADGSNGES